MIVTDEEQGYAPAAYLESIDKTYDSLEPEVSSNEGKERIIAGIHVHAVVSQKI